VGYKTAIPISEQLQKRLKPRGTVIGLALIKIMMIMMMMMMMTFHWPIISGNGFRNQTTMQNEQYC